MNYVILSQNELELLLETTDFDFDMAIEEGEWDDRATGYNLYEDGSMDYDVDGQTRMRSYQWEGISFKKISENQEVFKLN